MNPSALGSIDPSTVITFSVRCFLTVANEWRKLGPGSSSIPRRDGSRAIYDRLFIVSGTNISNGGVYADTVIEDFDVLADGGASFTAGLEIVAVGQALLPRAPEDFGGCVVYRYSARLMLRSFRGQPGDHGSLISALASVIAVRQAAYDRQYSV